MPGQVSSELGRVRQVAVRDKEARFTALLHHATLERLLLAYQDISPKAAPGVDGVTWEAYGQDLVANLRDLHERVQQGRYRASPSRRAYIPKADGRLRPLGIAALEDKIVQRAVVMVLNAIYEADFLGFSYGFRPGRSQHDALDALAFGIKGRYIWWILDADIRRFFDTISHEWLIRFLEHRIGDRRIIRLIQKWLRAGVLDEGTRLETTEGTPQGAVISPFLANVYLHYVYDVWVRAWRKRHATGDMVVVRYADDTVVGFQHRQDANRFLCDLKERLAKFALELHPEKTRLIEFGRFAAERRLARGVGKPETFDFLGFTHICGTKLNGNGFQLRRKTKRRRRWDTIKRIAAELRQRRHEPIDVQGRWLTTALKGHYAYFAVPTNLPSVRALRHHVKVRWYLSLARRSQRRRLNWRRMNVVADKYLPFPTVLHPWPEQRFLVKHPR